MMRPVIFRCPTTGERVQTHVPSATPADGPQVRYDGVECLACGRMHFVNLETGRLLSEEHPD